MGTVADVALQHGELWGLWQASYALGYNLAIEYLADYEKTWMLDSFRLLNKQVLEPQGRPLSHWEFLEVQHCPLLCHVVRYRTTLLERN